MKILISGGTGFIGSALCELLTKEHDVVVRSRKDKLTNPRFTLIKTLDQIDDNEQFDVAINLAGEPIADKRWSESQKQKLLESRLSITEEFISFFKRTHHKPTLFISSSAIGFYGVKPSDQAIDESFNGDDSFSANLCRRWEDIALQANALDIRTCLLRTGIVLGNGGALKKMLPPFRFGLGGKMGTGSQWMSWIHIDDMIGLIHFCITNEKLVGPINCTSPQPVKNLEFTEVLGKVLRRPAIFTVPSLVIKLLLGKMGEELLLSGKKIIPAKAQNAGYQFKYRDLEGALVDLLN
ncbi:MAG: TIGR01777 family oxidoreductase [Cellvibrionaceae bacterium]